MMIEKAFKLMSLPVLGLMALACAPNAKTNPPARPPAPIEVSAELELETVAEIEMINSGHFQPFQAGLDDQPNTP
jgi:hypothetical protein